jgi:hypothetical protein
MTLPPWRSDNRDEQQALSRFIISELDRADAARTQQADPALVSHFQLMVELSVQAKRLGMALNLPEPSCVERTEFEMAKADVPRIRALFQLYWRKRNRTKPPLAETIAAERWELSSEETAKLIDKFQRKSTVSQKKRD